MAASQASVMPASERVDVGADFFEVFLPVLAEERVHAELVQPHDSVRDRVPDEIGHVRVEARRELDDSVEALAVEVVLVVRERVVHLNGALRVANVLNFVLVGSFLDGTNVSWVVILSHVRPVEVPVSRVVRRKSRVALAILRSAVIAEPDVVALVEELELEGFVVVAEASEPAGCVLQVSMLDQDGAEGVGDIDRVLPGLAGDVEGC